MLLGIPTHITGEITRDRVVVQEFIAEHKYLESVSIEFGTYCRQIHSDLILKLTDHHNVEIARCTVPTYSFIDNAFFAFALGKKLKVGKIYKLVLYSSTAVVGMAVTAKFGRKQNDCAKNFMINGVLVPESALYATLDYREEKQAKNKEQIRIEKIIRKRRKEKFDFNIGLISVIIPVYNDYKYLEECLKSIEAQNYNHFEVIIVDDGSQEKIPDFFDEFSFPIEFIKARHGGSCKARNKGARKAKGEYLFFCDVDCKLNKNCFLELVMALQSDYYDVAYCNFEWGTKVMKGKPYNKNILFSTNFISTMSLMRKKKFIKFDEKLKRLQDWDLWIRMTKKKCNFTWVDKFLFSSPDRPGGITHNTISWDEAVRDLKKKHKELR